MGDVPEEWRDTLHDGYRVSSYGRVTGPKGLLKPFRGGKGDTRLSVKISTPAGKKTTRVHVLVVTAFEGPRPTGMQCRHLDGNNQNNRADNLKWGTQSENEADKHLHGTAHLRGPKSHQSWTVKLTYEQVREIRTLYATGKFSQQELAEKFGIVRTGVEKIVNRKTWKTA